MFPDTVARLTVLRKVPLNLLLVNGIKRWQVWIYRRYAEEVKPAMEVLQSHTRVFSQPELVMNLFSVSVFASA
ncbi:MAG: hypothetical protein ACI8PB_003931 [Desulforhopalus sp.]|jgi:hypothetical protein